MADRLIDCTLKIITIIFLVLMTGCSNNELDGGIEQKSYGTVIGMDDVETTTVSSGTVFISLTGKNEGETCTQSDPCNFSRLDYHADNPVKIEPGDVVFFRGGTYKFSMDGVRRLSLNGGTEAQPVIYESYPGETAIFSGELLSVVEMPEPQEWREGKIFIEKSHTAFRRFEIKNIPESGIRILGNHNVVEGCSIHDNRLTGVEIYNGVDGFSNEPTGGSYNIVRHNLIYNNSDAGLHHANYDDGNNADGVSVYSGVDNRIENNTIYNNSDDGIDTFKSVGTKVNYNLVYGQGGGAKGNGNGLKLGGIMTGDVRGFNITARHNIVYHNKFNGITVHGANNNVTVEYNTAFQNGQSGFTSLEDTRINYNISSNNGSIDDVSKSYMSHDNSWQKYLPVLFVSSEPDESERLRVEINGSNFLRPIEQYLSQKSK